MKKQDNEEENILDNDDNADMKNQEDDLFDNDKKKERDDESPMGVGRWVGSLILLEMLIVLK